MPYQSILKTLLENIDGAVGAGFVDYDGEVVQLTGQFEDFAHRIHLAYQGIFLENLKSFHEQHLGPPLSVVCVYQNLTLVIKPLKSGYFLVLTLAHGKQLAKALRAAEEAAAHLNLDL
jgi:hypothetical protein